MRNKLVGIVLMVLLAGCGPADVNQTVNNNASAVTDAASAIPADLGATAESLIDPTTAAEIQKTAESLLGDPTALAEAQLTAEALLTDPTVVAGANELVGTIAADLRLQQDQPLVLDASKQAADISNYRWTMTGVPTGAETVRGQVIQENSDGKLTLAPTDYAKYFPITGFYTVTLDLTFTGGTTESTPIVVYVP